MASSSRFRIQCAGLELVLSGSDDFMKSALGLVAPMVADTMGRWAPAEGRPRATQALAGREGELRAWAAEHGAALAASDDRDRILLIAFWMRRFRHYVFSSRDVAFALHAAELAVPEDLGERLEALTREGAWLLATAKQGEYMLNVPAIGRAQELLKTR